MRLWRKFAFLTALSALLVFGLSVEAADSTATLGEGRYFVATENTLVKRLFGARYEFPGGFTTDLTRGELWALEKIFGIGVKEVPLWSINSENPITAGLESLFGIPSAKKEPPSRKPSERKFFPADPTGWGIETIYQNPLISGTSGGEGAVVAVLDTGAEIKHLDIKRRIRECVDFTRSSIVTNTCEDKNGHGTHVAGVVVADAGADGLGLWGVAPQAELLAYKVCRNDGTCWADDVAVAIGYAVQSGANVISMSFGGPRESPLVSEAVKAAYKANVLLAAAAGNAGPKTGTLTYPAVQAEVVAVGAIDSELLVPDWSSRGVNDGDYLVENGEIEFVSPGVDIESTWFDGSYRYLTGTSMAAPFVSGLAAKLWDGVATSTRALIQQLTIDIAPLGDDPASGFGLPVIK